MGKGYVEGQREMISYFAATGWAIGIFLTGFLVGVWASAQASQNENRRNK